MQKGNTGILDVQVRLSGMTLKMASAMFAERLDNFQHSTRLSLWKVKLYIELQGLKPDYKVCRR
jgi:hypothetical protein